MTNNLVQIKVPKVKDMCVQFWTFSVQTVPSLEEQMSKLVKITKRGEINRDISV